jgi:predicted MFS family arabinose efflux permease
MQTSFSTVWLLAAVNAVAMSASPMIMLIGSLIGTELAPSERWATLPIALMVIGTATGVLPASRCMAQLGRKWAFLAFIGVGIGACVLAGEALARSHFILFCAGSYFIGAANAALQQIRFAAMEAVPLDKGPTAASVIMCAGIVAAFLGPELAVAGRHISAVEYRGSFWLGIGCYAAAGALLLAYRPAPAHAHNRQSDGRPMRQMLSNPALLLAVASGAVAFVVMSFVMTATPISMHVHHGHSLEDTKWVIQSHIAAMFLPSLATAWLFRWLSIRALMWAGLMCYVATIVIGLIDSSVLGFWGQLVMLGVGWNFLFVSGTALLPTTYQEGEQYRAQALNDTTVFSAQALASLSAGWAISSTDWHTILLLCLLPMALLAATLLAQSRRSK